MWALAANKRSLLDLFGKEGAGAIGKASQTSVDVLNKDLPDELLLFWARKPAKGDLPTVIVVRDDASREFIAWATTAIGGYRPFTAFFKVMDKTQAQQAFGTREPTLGKLEGPLVGLIIGEALTQSANRQSVQNLSLLPCKSTYSYSIARAYALGYYQSVSQKDTIADAWTLARKLTRQPTRRLADEYVKIAFNVIMALEGKSSGDRLDVPEFVIEVCRELFFQGTVEKSWRLLEGRLPSLDELAMKMLGPREKRVRAFEEVLKSPTGLDPISAAFLAGLFGSQIGQGTFEHVELLSPHIPEYQMALVWYGICVGLHQDTEVQESADCLGRRLVRDLLFADPILSPPKYDISVAELEVCLDREEPLNFRVASHSHIAVEIAPGVPAIMRWPVSVPTPEDQRSSPTKSLVKSPVIGKQASLFPENHDNDLLRQGEAAMLDLDRAVGHIKTVFGELGKRRNDGKLKDNKEKPQRRSKRH